MEKTPFKNERIRFTANDACTRKRNTGTVLQSKERRMIYSHLPLSTLVSPIHVQHIEIHSIRKRFKYFTLPSWYRHLSNHLLMTFHFCYDQRKNLIYNILLIKSFYSCLNLIHFFHYSYRISVQACGRKILCPEIEINIHQIRNSLMILTQWCTCVCVWIQVQLLIKYWNLFVELNLFD